MTVELINVTKHYHTLHGRHTVYRDFSLTIPRRRNVGVIGRNGAGKSTLLRLIAGAEKPDKGKVVRSMSVSWPLGFSGFFNMHLTGAANATFCARLYGRDPKHVVEFVREWSELGSFVDWPVKSYSTGMRARLAFALSLAIDFDCILIDEALSVGDAAFRQKARNILEDLREKSSFVLVTHNIGEIIRICDSVVLLGGASPAISDDVEGTVKRYHYEQTGEHYKPKMKDRSLRKAAE